MGEDLLEQRLGVFPERAAVLENGIEDRVRLAEELQQRHGLPVDHLNERPAIAQGKRGVAVFARDSRAHVVAQLRARNQEHILPEDEGLVQVQVHVTGFRSAISDPAPFAASEVVV
ncbi:MAG TPA: hypothetical protein VF266_02185 [Thermoanaerobaculia bacterium]